MRPGRVGRGGALYWGRPTAPMAERHRRTRVARPDIDAREKCMADKAAHGWPRARMARE